MLNKSLYHFGSTAIKRAPLISVEELKELQKEKKVKIFASSFKMPPSAKNDKYEVFDKERIPSAQYFDYDLIRDKTSDLPHMLPQTSQFGSLISHLEIDTDSHIVIYDDFGVIASSRVYWMLTSFGFKNVYVLDGGFAKWKASEKTENTQFQKQQEKDDKQYKQFKLRQKQIKNYEEVQEVSYLAKNDKIFEIIDARSEDRFLGKVPEPRDNLRSGNIPGSKNIPYTEVLNPDNTFKENSELRELFNKKNIDLNKHVVNTCGSGMTASVLYLALELVGQSKKSIYDGSWSEYGQKEVKKQDSEIEKQLSNVVLPDNLGEPFYFVRGQTYNLCTCGRSNDFPICSGVHVGTAFKPHKFHAEETGPKRFMFSKKTNTFEFD